MSDPLEMEPAWPRRRWWRQIGFILAAQLGLIFWLSDRSPEQRKSAILGTRYGLAFRSPSAPAWVEALELKNPALFGGASRHGFSGLAWLREPDLKNERASEPDRPEYPVFQDTGMSLLLSNLVETGLVPNQDGSPRLAPPLTAPSFLPPPQKPRSILNLEGALAERGLVGPVELPTQFFNDILSNSVVQVGVNDRGQVWSARLFSGSGSKNADLDAVAIARGLRFNPLPGQYVAEPKPEPRLEWGRLNFQWFALELVETNKASR